MTNVKIYKWQFDKLNEEPEVFVIGPREQYENLAPAKFLVTIDGNVDGIKLYFSDSEVSFNVAPILEDSPILMTNSYIYCTNSLVQGEVRDLKIDGGFKLNHCDISNLKANNVNLNYCDIVATTVKDTEVTGSHINNSDLLNIVIEKDNTNLDIQKVGCKIRMINFV